MAESRELETITALLGAHREKIAAPAVEEDLVDPVTRKTFAQSRVRAVRSWLFALGYLADDTDKPGYDDALRAAVRHFQAEAGLEKDGWIGTEETWPRLRELITFDDPVDLEHWDTGGDPRPALARAARARLALYGFGKPGEETDAARLEDHIRDFIEVLSHLGLDQADVPGGGAQRFVFVLSHDKHVDFLTGPETDGRFAQIVHRERTAAAYNLMMNVAKVELWLAQAGPIDLTTRHRQSQKQDGSFGLPKILRKAMRQFMDALGEGDDIGSHRGKFLAASNGDDWPRAIRLYLEATIRFARDDDAMAPERVEELHQFYDKGTVTGRERAKATARELREGGLRSRLWDGLKRVFAWVRKALAEAVESAKKLLKVARRIAAYAFQVASEAVSWVYDAVKRFTTHVKAAVDRHHRDDDGHVVVICSFGRDTDLFVSSAAPLGYARNYTERLHLSAQIFRQACRILGTLVGFALRLVTGALTVAALLQTLVFALTRASGLRDAFREIARLELRYRLLEREANIGA